MYPFQRTGYFFSSTLIAGFILLFLIISGITLLSDSVFGWTALAMLAVSAILFLDIPEKLLFSFFAAFLITLGGLLPMPVAVASFLASAFCMELIFRLIFKHHAPLPDSFLIAGGTLLFLLFIPIMNWLASMMGFSAHEISWSFLFASAFYCLLFAPAMFLALAGISNYSRYGSIY